MPQAEVESITLDYTNLGYYDKATGYGYANRIGAGNEYVFNVRGVGLPQAILASDIEFTGLPTDAEVTYTLTGSNLAKVTVKLVSAITDKIDELAITKVGDVPSNFDMETITAGLSEAYKIRGPRTG